MSLADELAEAQDLPFDALRRAAKVPGQIAGGVLSALEKAGAGETIGDREANLVFWGVHVLAQARDARVFAPLLRLLRQPPEVLEPVIGDAFGTTLGRVLASTFDGDAEALCGAILDPTVDEAGRWVLFDALVTLTVARRVEREVAHDLARRFEAERSIPAGEMGWIGWAELVATLGFADLASNVEAALAGGRILDDLIEPSWFAETLAAFADTPATLYDLDPLQFGFVEDAAAELEEAMADDVEGEAEPLEPTVNPLRHVGRNDPCPCGSGRKFKSCCLGKEAAGASASGVSSLPPLPLQRGR